MTDTPHDQYDNCPTLGRNASMSAILQVANRLCANKDITTLNLGIFENFPLSFVKQESAESERSEDNGSEESDEKTKDEAHTERASTSSPGTTSLIDQSNDVILPSPGTMPNSILADGQIHHVINNNMPPVTSSSQLQLHSQNNVHEINTANSMIPRGQSPWMRNAGRKKSHPVWQFFRDLKATNEGSSGVMCLHCDWLGDDRSPNNLRTHLKKFHSNDGVFARFSEKLAATPTQPYVKRARGVGGNQNPNVFFPDNLNMALHNLHNNMHNRQSNEEMSAHPSFAFLDSIPKINEVINISAGFNAHHSHTDEDSEHNDLGNEPSSSAASEGDDGHQTPSIGYCGHASDSEPQTQVPTSQLSDSPSSTHVPFIGGNHAANFLGKPSEIPVSSSPFSLLTMVNNPILYMNALTSLASSTNGQTPMLSAEVLQQTLRGVISQESTVSATENNALRPPSQQPLDAQGCAFSLQDPRCMTSLMKMTLDLDLTLSYHRRRGDVEWCFESNRTAEKSGGRGKVLCLSDLGKEIRVSERSNGNVTESELWTKTDFTQFQWAIRGKCQKALLK